MFTQQQKELAIKVCDGLNLSLDISEDASCDPAMLINGDIDLSRNDGLFVISEVTVIPGVRYTANGDGFPDEADIAYIEEHERFEEALKAALRYAMVHIVNNTINNLADDAAVAAMMEDEAMAATLKDWRAPVRG